MRLGTPYDTTSRPQISALGRACLISSAILGPNSLGSSTGSMPGPACQPSATLRMPSPASNTRPVTSRDSSLASQTTIGATQRGLRRGVDLSYIGFAGLRHHAEGRCRAAIGRGVSDLDFAVGDARTVFFLAGGCLTGESKQRCRDGEASRDDHDFLRHFVIFAVGLPTGSAGLVTPARRRIR